MIQILSGIQSTASALTAERTRLDVIAENIANAQTTRGPDGRPYQRRVVVFETVLQQASDRFGTASAPAAVRVARIQTDPRPPLLVYRPGHPDADAQGMVALPNINVHEEMADLIAASRAFEANLAVVKNARAMALQTLAIGKR
ncbi:flagellar basal body rod protein FlgC [Limisphaera sp. VF-2]|jgi:flagellar basal-body rod protein FlgC|uniref:flagellar basal body rod protein FlgC n=1 Tax=Limisphaera sp. VF-2 TaxID=3400418 RepID=UPI00256C6A18|nr:flagellar basal body rod protein FlgC [Limisphaera sp.]